MPELRSDPVTGRWVILSSERQKRPTDFQFEQALPGNRDQCPFCPGHEAMTPPEVLADRPGGGVPDTPGWRVRVVPNKYPALQLDAPALDRESDGMFDRLSGIGAHEVIVETPDHDRPLAQQSEDQIARVLSACRERMLDLACDERLQYILVFKNHAAAAGATLAHPHAQLIALPIVPDFVRDEVEGARRHFAASSRCVFCDILEQDRRDGRRVIEENAEMIAIAPWAPRAAFETWLLPRRHGARFEEAPRSEIEALARVLKSVLQRMDQALGAPPFNLVLHTSPLAEGVADLYHWHVEIMPKLTRVAGFEWGTGFYINPTPPEEAAAVLRGVRLKA